jgi:diacylglycerol kinase
VVTLVTKTTAFSFRKCAESFRYAWRGLAAVLRGQHNARIHACATCVVIALGLAFRVGAIEWAVLSLAMLAVWAAECSNTAVELLGDAVSQQDHPFIGAAKDAAAGAVLVAAIGNTIVDLLVFGPRFLRLVDLMNE